jgi:hypothetical protein
LPDGNVVAGARYEGKHPARQALLRVCLLSGQWSEPNTGAGGSDLVSLIAHTDGLTQRSAAYEIAKWLGVPVVRHA